MDSEYDVKYPKSRNNFQCLGPCYEPRTFIIHPTTLEHVTDFQHPFCPVNEWERINPSTGEKELLLHDTCYKPTTISKISNKEIEMNIILPKIDFNCDHFLKIYYKIYSMEGVMEWLEKNNHLPYYTIKRVLDCAWRSYGMNDYIIDDRIVLYYIQIAKTRWINKIYKRIGKYIYFNDNKLTLSNTESTLTENTMEKINFIVDKFINSSTMAKFLNKFVEYYSNNPNIEISSYTDILQKDFIDHIEKKVDYTIKS